MSHAFPVPLEKYEWDQMWIEHTENTAAPRVLYIGDSISVGVLPQVNALAAGSVLYDAFSTSKGLDNPCFPEAILTMARQQGRRDLIVINNGYHGLHLSDEEDYPLAFERMLAFLQESFPGTPIALILTTHGKNEEWEKRALCRNDVVRKLAEKWGIPLIDFYAASLPCEHLLRDTVHFVPEGYQALARCLHEKVLEILKG